MIPPVTSWDDLDLLLVLEILTRHPEEIGNEKVSISIEGRFSFSLTLEICEEIQDECEFRGITTDEEGWGYREQMIQ